MTFICSNFPIASCFTFTLSNSQSPHCGLQGLYDLPSLHLFSLISSCHSTPFILVPCTFCFLCLESTLPDDARYSGTLSSFLQAFAQMSLNQRNLPLSTLSEVPFPTFTLSPASLFCSTNHSLTLLYVHLCLYRCILFFSYNVHILQRQECVLFIV